MREGGEGAEDGEGREPNLDGGPLLAVSPKLQPLYIGMAETKAEEFEKEEEEAGGAE